MESINLNTLCNKDDVRSLYPVQGSLWTASYRYSQTIRSKLLNYSKVVKKEEVPKSCSCDKSPFKDPIIGHVVTGDLSIVQNRKLRNLMCKGTNFRECEKFLKKDLISSIEKDLDDHISKQSKKKKLPENTFQLWKLELMSKITSSLDHTQSRKTAKPILKDPQVIKDLRKLHSEYVFTPTDKASNNVSIVCKHFYHMMLQDELQSPTYCDVTEQEEDIVHRHVNDLQEKGLTVEEEERKLPFIYWTAKQHKTPISQRYIVSGKFCTTKILSKKLLHIFKLLLKTLKNNCRYKCKFLKTKAFWIINNAQPLRQDIHHLNNKRKAQTVYTYDFTRLYTNIPHDLLREQVKFVIDEAFNIKADKNFIRLNKCSASWAETIPKNSKCLFVDKNEILEYFDYLLNNIYVKYGDKIFRQIIGIPMGTDCAPDLANLFLFAYEYKYVFNLINTPGKSDELKLFRFVHRYIDDLIILNDKGHFDRIFKDIYPTELELKLTSGSQLSANYLDLQISIDKGRITHSLYDKRNDFDFKVISMPNMSSNVPVKPTYGVFYSQVLRLFNANNRLPNFIGDVKVLVDKLCKQNFEVTKLKHELHEFNNKFHYQIVSKYWDILNINMIC